MKQPELQTAAESYALLKTPVQGEVIAIAAFKSGALWQKEQGNKKRVWVNIVDGSFSNSWQVGGLYDIKFSNWEEEIKEAAKRGWKLIEYTCVNDPDFELYNQMKLR